MAYPKHLLLSFGGAIGNLETWSCGLRLWSPGFAGLDDATAAEQGLEHVEEVDTKVRAYITSVSAHINGWCRHGFTKLNAIGGDGKYLGTTTSEVIHSPQFNPNGAGTGPYQISTVVSLETGVNRGLAVSGRFFLPGIAQPTDNTGAMQVELSTALAALSATFVRNLNNWAGIDTNIAPDVSVVSRGKKGVGGAWGTGLARPVTGVAVGRIQDTQRRRRGQLDERYQHEAL